ncbi:MAG: hypothetical protein Ct9H300mP1_35100 [Planctomycetaceae bacterium]|nr:MAG: hypothetical protein Ct9H300mP1_35100 [Planctomycetaceae bacterium]
MFRPGRPGWFTGCKGWGRGQPVLMAHTVALGLVALINQLGFLFGGDAEHPEVHQRVMAILAVGWLSRWPARA